MVIYLMKTSTYSLISALDLDGRLMLRVKVNKEVNIQKGVVHDFNTNCLCKLH